MNYNEQCKKKQCEYYIEWEFYDGDFHEQPYNCTSCKLQGQSYDITEIAKDCPYKDRAIIQQQVQPDNGYVCNRPGSCAKGQRGKCYSGLDCPDKAVAG